MKQNNRKQTAFTLATYLYHKMLRHESDMTAQGENETTKSIFDKQGRLQQCNSQSRAMNSYSNAKLIVGFGLKFQVSIF